MQCILFFTSCAHTQTHAYIHTKHMQRYIQIMKEKKAEIGNRNAAPWRERIDGTFQNIPIQPTS